VAFIAFGIFDYIFSEYKANTFPPPVRLKSMQIFRIVVLLLALWAGLGLKQSEACSPFTDLTSTWSLVGNELRINLGSRTGWQCCFTGRIELRCASQAFTGTATHSTNTICKGSGSSSSSSWTTNAVAYQQVVINLSAYCPGTQLKWRAREQSPDGFSNYTPTYTFTVPGVLAPLTVAASANPTSVCPGGCATLSATSTGACGTPTYSWSPGGAGASISVCPAASTTYTVTVTDPGLLCPQVRTATSSVTVGILPPAVAGTASVLPVSVCSGQPVTISLVGNTGNVQWQSSASATGPWANIGGATGNSYLFPNLTATTYFRAQVSNACQTVSSNVVLATVNPTPQAAFTANAVCQGTATVFANTSTISSGSISTWLWDFGSGGATSSLASPSYTYASAGSYTVTLTATAASGCSHQVTQQVTVNPRPTVAFATSPVCLGQPMTFTNSSAITSGSISTWQWDFGNGATSAQPSPTHTYTQPGSFNVTLTATSALGCSNQVTQAVTVRPAPVVVFTANPVCLGLATTFTNSTSISSGSVATWLWNFGDGTATSAQQTPSHTYALPGTYTVTLTATSVLGCTGQATQQVTVRPRPVVQFSAAPVCAGLAMAFTNTSSIASGSISTWQWDFDGQGTSAQAAPSFTFSGPGTYNVSLTAQSDLGCSSSQIVPVTVNPVPVAQFSMTPVCAGTATVFTDQSSIGSPGQIASWSWAFGDGASAIQSSTTHTYGAAGNYPVTLTVSTANGCQNSTTQQAIVNPTPVSSFTATDACISVPSMFVNNSSVSSGNIASYAWNTGVATSNAATPPAQTYPQAGTYTASLTVTTNNGCVHTSQQQVVIHPDPVSAFQFTEVCLGEPTVLSDQSSISSGSITAWQWNLGDGTTPAQQSPSHTYQNFGTYTVSLTVSSGFGCTGQITQAVQVYTLPVASFTVADVCAYTAAAFVNTSTGGTSYQWDFGDGTTASQQNPPAHNYTFGTYTTQLTVQTGSGCSDVAQQQLTVHPVPQAAFVVTQVCDGDATVFTDNSTVPGTGQLAAWQWDFGDGATSAQPSPTHTYAADGSYSASLTVTTDNGCTNTVSVPVTVFPVPVSQFAMSSVCTGIATVFTDQSSVGQPSQIVTWQWDFGDGTTSAQQSPTHTYATDGTFAVALTVVTANGCQHVSTQQATVYPNPLSSFTLADICVSSQALFANTSSVSSGTIAANSWDLGVGTSTVVNPPAQSYAQPGTYAIILTVTTNNGCVHTSQQQLTVHPDPVAAFQFTEVCFGEATVFTNTSSISTGTISTTNWDFGDGNSSTQPSPSQVYAADGTFTVSLNVASVFGCSDQITQAVQVYPLPVASFTVADVCAYTAAAFVNTSTGGTSYQWDFGDGTTASQQNPPAHNYTFGTYTTQLTVQTGSGCSDVAQQQLTVHPVPQAAFVVTQVCDGDATVFTDNSTVPGTGQLAAWQWDFGDGATSAQPSPTHTYAADGSYSASLTVTTDNGCTNTVSVPVTVFPVPVSQFAMSSVCTGIATVFTDQSSVGQPSQIVTWQWDFGDGTTSAQQSPTHTYATDGTFAVALTVVTANGCQHVSTQQATVYPNPLSSFTLADICVSSQALFANTSSVSSGTIAANSWDLGVGTSTVVNPPAQSYAQPGTYAIILTVTTNNGCVHTSQQQLTVHPDPVAAFQFTEVCFGEATVFTNTSSISTGTISTTDWDFGDGNNFSGQLPPPQNYASQGNYTVTLSVQSALGCAHQISQSVQVFSLPVPAFTAADVCAYNPVVIGNTTAGATVYEWDFGDGTTANVQNPAPHSYTFGAYDIRLIALTGSGCRDTMIQTVNVFPAPTSSFTLADVCLGVQTPFANQSTVGGVGQLIQWDWNFGNGASFQGAAPNYTYPLAGSYQVSLVVTTADGCTGQATQTAQVFSLPVAVFTSSNVCEYDSAVVINVSAGATSYQWDFGDGTSAAVQSPPPHSYTFGTYNIQLIAENGNGCRDTVIRPIVIFPAPTADFTFANVCQGQQTPLVDQSVVNGAGQIAQWNWSFGNNFLGQGSSPDYTYPIWGSYQVLLTVTTSDGCISQAMADPVVVHPVPFVLFSNGLANCFGEVTDLLDFSTLANAPDDIITSWLWTFSDGGTSVLQNPSHLFTTEGMQTATLDVTSSNGCTGVAINNVEIYALPNVLFMADTTRGCQPFMAQFIDQTTILAPYFISNWQWEFGDGSEVVSGQFPVHTYYTPSLDPMGAGMYSVTLTVTSANGCVSSETYTDYMTEYPKPQAWFDVNPKRAELLFARMQVNDLSSPNVTGWEYDFDEGLNQFTQHPLHAYQDTGTFTITQYVTTQYGCLDTAQTTVKVDPEFYFYIPNTFTPNSDTHNQTFYGTGVGVVSYQMIIFDRWGSQVFESNAMDFPWNGTKNGHPVQQGVYTYMFNIVSVKGQTHQYVGHVNLVR